MAAAVRAGAVRIVVGLGGSSCTDGGRGMIDELAAHGRSRDKSSLIAARKLLAGVELIAATDVEHPLLGPMGAAAVFGPQKGCLPRHRSRPGAAAERLGGGVERRCRTRGQR
jgi:glycerate kinase